MALEEFTGHALLLYIRGFSGAVNSNHRISDHLYRCQLLHGLCLPFSFGLSFSLSLFLAVSLSCFLALSLSIFFSKTHTLLYMYSYMNTHTHTHTSLSLSLSCWLLFSFYCLFQRFTLLLIYSFSQSLIYLVTSAPASSRLIAI